MQSYKELSVFKRSYEQAKRLYEAVKAFPKEELYAMTSQIKRAATSIPLNIAEGYGKASGNRELLRFLSMARGSSVELEVLLNFAGDFGYMGAEECKAALEECEAIGRMLTGLMRSVESKII